MKNLQLDKQMVEEFCRRNHIRKMAFFGSVLRDDFNADSDVDVLVEFEPGYEVGMLRMSAMERELSSIFGRAVDLRTPAELSRFIRDRVVAGSEVGFVAG